MIFGAHVIVFSNDASADRAFFRDVLGYSWVDAGHDWLIFELPPAELAVHPADDDFRNELYLMCDDLLAELATLTAKGVRTSLVEEARWGSVTKIQLPGGGQIALYQPKHPIAFRRAPPDFACRVTPHVGTAAYTAPRWRPIGPSTLQRTSV